MKKILFICLVLSCIAAAQDTAQPYLETTDFPPCSLQGTVVLKSSPPALPARINVTADVATCGKNIENRNLLQSSSTGVENVIVYLEGVKSGKSIAKEKKVLISDEKCDFYPKALAVVKGQPVTFRNGDKIYNDFRAVLGGQVLFNIALPMAGQTFTRALNKCGMADLFCNVHSWEHALVLVSPHPYFAVSDNGGHFRIDQVPPGKYTLIAVHEVLGKKSIEIILTQGKTTEIQLEY